MCVHGVGEKETRGAESRWMEGQTKRSLNVCSKECMHTKSKKSEEFSKNNILLPGVWMCVSVLVCK